MKLMLDTNICIYIINQKPAHVIQRFWQYQGGDIGISVITAAELAYGIEKTGSERNRLALQKFLAPFDILPFDEKVVWEYARLRAALEVKGQTIGALDMQIAAHALVENVTLVTNNVREFSRVLHLKLENWV